MSATRAPVTRPLLGAPGKTEDENQELVDMSVEQAVSSDLAYSPWRARVDVVAPHGVVLHPAVLTKVSRVLLGRHALTMLDANVLRVFFAVGDGSPQTQTSVDRFGSTLAGSLDAGSCTYTTSLSEGSKDLIEAVLGGRPDADIHYLHGRGSA